MTIKVLVVEDDKISSKLINIILEEAGCTVELASSGVDALKLYFANNYDLVFMDVGLPDISGITITRLIRAYSANKVRVRIVALTAHVNNSYRIACLAAGMDAFLTKPIDAQHVQDIIDNFREG